MRYKTTNSIFALLLFFSFNLFAQQSDEIAAKDYLALAMPGEEHKLLSQLVGDWDQEYRFYMTPATEPIVSYGTSSHEMILGGRYLKMSAEGETMGQIVEGLTILGFDKRLQVFTFYGFDTMGTYAINPEGTYDKETNTITYTGKNYEPAMKTFSDYRIVMKIIDQDNYTFDLFFTFPGKEETRMLEMISKRKKQ